MNMADSLLPDDQSQPLTKESIIAKWKDKPHEELLEAKANADLFVATQNARFDDLRKDFLELKEQQQTGAQLKDLLDRLDKPITNQDQNDTTVQTPPGIKPEDIDAQIEKRLNDHQLRLKQAANFEAMQAKLKETLGSDYASSYKQRLDTLGLSREFADDLAKNHPSVFVKTFGLDEVRQQSTQNLPRSSVRPNTFAPQTKKRDWNYYQELKKSDPRMYLDPKIAVQMHDDAIALGADFGMPED
jgi:hypothetical protein